MEEPRTYQDQERIISEQQNQIELLEEENRQLRESYDIIAGSFFWKMTKPARVQLDILKWMFRPHAEKRLVGKTVHSLRINGLGGTWQKIMQRIYFSEKTAKFSKQRLFSDQELADQSAFQFGRKIRFSIVVPLYNTPECFLRDMIESVLAQTYGDWELCMADGSDAEHGKVKAVCREYVEKDSRIRYRKLENNLGISGNTNACLEMVTGDYIGLLDHDDLLHPAALHEVMQTICTLNADYIYTDESVFSEKPEDAYNPHFKPDYAPDTLVSNNYICHFSVFQRSLLDDVGWFDPACDGSQDHDLILRLTEKAMRVAHIPEVLYYWRASSGSVAQNPAVKSYTISAGIRAVEKHLARLGREGEVSAVRPGMTIYRVRYAIQGKPKVSILISNYEHLKTLNRCLDSIYSKTTWPDYEIVIVDCKSFTPKIFSYYEELQKKHGNLRVVTWKGEDEDNESAVCNVGVQFCSGDYILLLSRDMEVLTPNWIEEMLMFAQREDVGAVGAKILYPDNTICSAGIGLGFGGSTGAFFTEVSKENVGYFGRLIYAQNVSAVSADCMLLQREIWEKMGGLDESFIPHYNAVDLCLRIRKVGYLIVWTPFAELSRMKREQRRKKEDKETLHLLRTQEADFRHKWKKELKEGDPYFNPNFSTDRTDFAVSPIMRQHDAR